MNNDALAKSLDVLNETSKEIVVKEEDISVVDSTEVEDFKFARRTLKDVVDLGTEALEGILAVASDTDEPRAYEVAGQILKSVTESTKELYGLHKKRKETIESTAQEVRSGPQNQYIDKAIFVGTPTELLNKLKNMSND